MGLNTIWDEAHSLGVQQVFSVLDEMVDEEVSEPFHSNFRYFVDQAKRIFQKELNESTTED